MPSPPPALLKEVTDEVLVVAADSVLAAVAQAECQPSGREQSRLLRVSVGCRRRSRGNCAYLEGGCVDDGEKARRAG